MKNYTAAAFCAIGAEKVVSNELKKLASFGSGQAEKGTPEKQAAYTILESSLGRVRFKTDLAGLYRALMSLRTADRLLLEAGTFPAPNFDALFEGAASIPWEDYIPRGMGLKVSKVRSSLSRLTAETSIQAVVHKAAAQRLCRRYGLNRLPGGTGGTKTNSGGGQFGIKQAELRVFMEKDKAFLLLDLSGEPLFKRCYRPAGGIAPLRESTAAAIVLFSGWKRKFPLYDPLCGSGTIIIEAALYAWDQAPGLGRHFALSDLSFGNSRIEQTVRQELAEKIDYSRPINIKGSDADEKAIALAKANLLRARCLPEKMPGILTQKQHAGFGGKIPGVELRCLSMKDASLVKLPGPDSPKNGTAPALPPGFIITNPPYGNRLGEIEEAEKRYADMVFLNKAFSGWKLALICDHAGFESHFGKKADSCRKLKSGAADAWLYQYEKI